MYALSKYLLFQLFPFVVYISTYNQNLRYWSYLCSGVFQCCLFHHYIGWTWRENDRPTFQSLCQELCQLSIIKDGQLHLGQLGLNSVCFVGRTTPRSATLPRIPKKPALDKLRQCRLNSNPIFDSSTSQELYSVQPISDDPDHVMAQINRVSASLFDFSLEGFSVHKRSLEYFLQLSEKMLQLMRALSISCLVSTRIALDKLTEKIADFRDLLEQIDSSLPYDCNFKLDEYVKSITASIRNLHIKLH